MDVKRNALWNLLTFHNRKHLTSNCQTRQLPLVRTMGSTAILKEVAIWRLKGSYAVQSYSWTKYSTSTCISTQKSNVIKVRYWTWRTTERPDLWATMKRELKTTPKPFCWSNVLCITPRGNAGSRSIQLLPATPRMKTVGQCHGSSQQQQH